MFCVDSVIFLVLGVISCIMVFGASILPFSYAWPAVVVFVVIASFSCVLFSFWLSFWFDREETATRWLFFVTIFSYMVLSVLVLMIPMSLELNSMDGPTQQPQTENMNWIAGVPFAVFFPPCTLLGALIEVSKYVSTYPLDKEPVQIFGAFEQTSVIVYLIVSIIQIPLLILFIAAHETRCFKKRKSVQYVGEENESVVNVKNLSVRYTSCCCCCKKKKNAVNNLDFEFDNGKLFLLLDHCCFSLLVASYRSICFIGSEWSWKIKLVFGVEW